MFKLRCLGFGVLGFYGFKFRVFVPYKTFEVASIRQPEYLGYSRRDLDFESPKP